MFSSLSLAPVTPRSFHDWLNTDKIDSVVPDRRLRLNNLFAEWDPRFFSKTNFFQNIGSPLLIFAFLAKLEGGTLCFCYFFYFFTAKSQFSKQIRSLKMSSWSHPKRTLLHDVRAYESRTCKWLVSNPMAFKVLGNTCGTHFDFPSFTSGVLMLRKPHPIRWKVHNRGAFLYFYNIKCLIKNFRLRRAPNQGTQIGGLS